MTIEGLDALRRRWARIPQLMQDNVRIALEKLADEIVKEMKAAAPKGETLRLVDSIGWTWGDAPAGAMTIGRAKRSGGSDLAYGTMQITIYAGGGDAFYAIYQELGTVNMLARPFFFNVWRQKKKGLKRRVQNAIKAALAAH